MKSVSKMFILKIVLYTILFLVFSYLFAVCANAQVPMRYNYQAVARNTTGSILANQSIGIRVGLMAGSPTGNVLYMERHTVTTNQFGVFSLQVGSGIVDLGSMNAVPWSAGNVWMKVEMDASGGTNFVVMGSTQLLSVPYAMVSGTSLSGGSGTGSTFTPQSLDSLTDVQISNPVLGQVLKFDGSKWSNGTDNTSGSGGSSAWSTNGNHIYNTNSGNIGIGTSSPTSLFHLKNSLSTSTTNIFSIENTGLGYNFYSYKTGASEAVYLVKDNASSGTPNIYATNNGHGNTMDVFATGDGYAANFRGASASLGAVYAKVTSSGYAGFFDGDITGGGVRGKAATGYASYFEGKNLISFDGTSTAVPHLMISEVTQNEFARISLANTGGSYWQIAGMGNTAGADASRLMIFYGGSNEGINLLGNGNLGLGTQSPIAKMHLISSGTYASPVIKIENTNLTNVSAMISINNSGNGELINATKPGIGYGINIQKTGNVSSSATIYGSTAGSNGEGIRGSAFGAGGYGVYGNAVGTGTASYTGIYGYGSGSTGVDYGIYGQQGVGTNDYAAYFNGNVGYTGTLSATSDERLKKNIKSFNQGLDLIMQLKPSTYEYNNEKFADMNLPVGNQYGLVAQDIEKIIPELVSQTSFTSLKKQEGEVTATPTTIDYKCVNYMGLIPVLISAVQEQQKEIAELKIQIAELKK
jgi:hypothetical protein